MKKLRLKMILVLMLSGILFSFVSSAYKPTQVQAISSKQRSVRKRTKKKRRGKSILQDQDLNGTTGIWKLEKRLIYHAS